MTMALQIPARRRARFPLARCPHSSPRPRRGAVSEGAELRHPRQRRRVQYRRQSCRLFRDAHGNRQRDGRLSDRRSHRRASQGDGRQAVLQTLQARRRPWPEHGDRLQRSGLRRPRPDGLLQPRQRGRRAVEAGRLQLERDLRRRRALVPQRRHLRGFIGHDLRAHHRGDGGGQGARRRGVVRPQLP